LCPVVESFFQLKEVEMRTGELRVTFWPHCVSRCQHDTKEKVWT
jgi:hypothetical protein